MRQYYIILDIETTGIPANSDKPAEDLDNWPGILEIAWQLYDDDQELINEQSLIVRPDNGKISEEIEELTGITTDYANENGVSILAALIEFTSVLQKFNPVIVAHNCDFDTKVIEANLLKNSMDITLTSYDHICTMKESTEFCGLPNLKYPKLSELYRFLFSVTPNTSHRALPDVQATAKAFFKLIDLDVISLKERSPLAPSQLEALHRKEVEKAIESYISDLEKYPLFYDLRKVFVLATDSIIDQVRDRYNKYYQTAKAKTFEIPYNQVANRTVIALSIEDILIRYVLTNYLKEQTNFIPSTERYDAHIVRNLCQREIDKGHAISIKVDIYDCYESIDYSKLRYEISKELQLSENSTYLTVFTNALQVIYETEGGDVVKKETGLLIGSKPDEFLAEFFLDKVEARIKRSGISVIRIADEFIFFADTFVMAREKFNSIQELVSEYGLSLNRSKTIIQDYRQEALNQQFNLELVNVGGSIPLFSYRLSKVDTSTSENSKGDVSSDSRRENMSNDEIEVQSYESAILFLKQMAQSEKEIKEYQERYPKYRYLYNIVHSQPTCFRNDFYHLDTSAFSKANIEKLKKIIYYYPKNEYYVALAIQLLTFAATNTVHVTDRFELSGFGKDYELPNFYYLHETCELANLTIVELLQSDDVHEYQKYILLRSLFKKRNALELDLDSYNINTVHYHFGDELRVIETLPFKFEVLKETSRIAAKTNHYPLKMICQELGKRKNTFTNKG